MEHFNVEQATGNLLVHQWSITQIPHMIEIYNQLYYRDSFKLIKISCDVDERYLTKNEPNHG